jgi:CRISPR system Cascade subunit CasE
MHALFSPNMLHGALERTYRGDRQRNLWRVDWVGDDCYLLVLSREQLDFTPLIMDFGFPDAERAWETKNYESLLSRLQPGQQWQFRLCANPVRSSSRNWNESSGRGRVFAHVTAEQQKQWLLTRAERHGFELDNSTFEVVHSRWLRFRKGRGDRHEVRLRTATFDGVLTISDRESLIEALVFGIGRAKAYGCGLLTLARCGGTSSV